MLYRDQEKKSCVNPIHILYFPPVIFTILLTGIDSHLIIFASARAERVGGVYNSRQKGEA
jgi:hypothetical protein